MTRQHIVERLCTGDGLIDAHTHLGADLALYANGDYPYAISAEDHGVRLAHTGIATALCFPWLYTNYFSLAAFRRGCFRRDPRSDSSYPYAFENERLCQEIYQAFPEYAGRLLPFAFFDPLRRTREQAAGIRALAARFPLFGLKTATSYLQVPVTALLKQGSCLLDLAAELNLPVTLHSAVAPDDAWANVFDILTVVRARPDVRFAIAHTCRFDRRALDAAAETPNGFVDLSAFHIHCVLARQNHAAVAAPGDRFVADYRHPGEVMRRLAETYPGNLIWGTDTPAHVWKSHGLDAGGHEFWLNLSCPPTAEAETLHRLPLRIRKRIARDTTLRYLFGNDTSACP